MQYYGMVEDDQWKYERMRKGNRNSNNELKNNNLFRVVGYIYIYIYIYRYIYIACK